MATHHLRSTGRALTCCAAALAGSLWGLTGPAGAAQAAPVAEGTYYQIIARHSGKCLDVAHASTDHAADVIQGNCSGGRNQQWRVEAQGDGLFEIQARHSGKCLDVAHASRAHAADVIQGTCLGGKNQFWWFKSVPGEGRLADGPDGAVPSTGQNVKIVAEHSGLVLDVAHGSIAHAANVLQANPWDPGFNQQWRFVPVR
ncbi:RICIN domain-containing protein [Streptomyces sp. NPDC051211]|uniref:RICIN domain-containing protein n=1 Tax=Streptomyces sp. NPDC051211 TaxID=3154643 RepID=UPI0034508CD0